MSDPGRIRVLRARDREAERGCVMLVVGMVLGAAALAACELLAYLYFGGMPR